MKKLSVICDPCLVISDQLDKENEPDPEKVAWLLVYALEWLREQEQRAVKNKEIRENDVEVFVTTSL